MTEPDKSSHSAPNQNIEELLGGSEHFLMVNLEALFIMQYPSFLDSQEWLMYHRRVTETYPNFFMALSKTHPGLSNHEIKLCALFLFGCEIAEIADRLGMNSIESVLKAKSRLRKKFKLKKSERLVGYLQRIAAGLIAPPPVANS